MVIIRYCIGARRASKKPSCQWIHLEKDNVLYVRSGLSADVSIIPTLNMGRLTRFFTYGTMLFWRNNRWIRLPIIGENQGLFIRRWDTILEYLTLFLIAITAGVSHHFSGLSAQCDPELNFGVATEDKGPDFIRFQHGCFPGINGFQGSFKGGAAPPFFNQALKVWRQTPKVRSIPRILERS